MRRDEQLSEYICELERKLVGVNFSPGVFGFVSDAGDKNAAQAALKPLLDNIGGEAYFFGGDNNLPDGLEATIEENWEEFADFVDCGIAIPALGQDDIKEADGTPQTDKFGLPQYYDVTFDRGGVHLFVLSSDDSTIDGNTVGSAQYDWFLDRLDSSVHKWKIVMFHHPVRTSINAGAAAFLVNSNMEWNFHELGIHLVLNGNVLANEHLRRYGLDYVNCSGNDVKSAPLNLENPAGITGDDFANTEIIWQDASDAGLRGTAHIVRIEARPTRMNVEFVKVSDGSISHQFTV